MTRGRIGCPASKRGRIDAVLSLCLDTSATQPCRLCVNDTLVCLNAVSPTRHHAESIASSRDRVLTEGGAYFTGAAAGLDRIRTWEPRPPLPGQHRAAGVLARTCNTRSRNPRVRSVNLDAIARTSPLIFCPRDPKVLAMCL